MMEFPQRLATMGKERGFTQLALAKKVVKERPQEHPHQARRQTLAVGGMIRSCQSENEG